MSDITDGIRDYLATGGLFNPELMDHQRVRDLVIECRDEIERLRGLLREYLTTDGQEFLGSYDDWLRRVREALGDR